MIETAADQAADELPADAVDDEELEEDVEAAEDEDASEEDDDEDGEGDEFDDESSLFADVGLDVPPELLDDEPRLSFR